MVAKDKESLIIFANLDYFLYHYHRCSKTNEIILKKKQICNEKFKNCRNQIYNAVKTILCRKS